MSEVSSILTSRVDLKRWTAVLLERIAVAASLSPNRQPLKACRLEVTIDGSTVTSGSVTVGSETINITGNGVFVGTVDHATISTVTTSGISDGFIKIKAVSEMGEPINQQIVVGANIASRFFQQQAWQREVISGQEVVARKLGTGIMFEPSQDLKIGDWVYIDYGIVGSTLFQTIFVEALYDFDGITHHIEGWLDPIK